MGWWGYAKRQEFLLRWCSAGWFWLLVLGWLVLGWLVLVTGARLAGSGDPVLSFLWAWALRAPHARLPQAPTLHPRATQALSRSYLDSI